VINDFETNGLQALDEAAARKAAGAFRCRAKMRPRRGRANQGNLLLLTGDFDRQERLLKFALTAGTAAG